MAIRNCIFEKVTIRSVGTRSGVSISHSKLGQLSVHDSSPLAVHATAIEGMLRVSRLRAPLEVSESSSDQLLILDSADPNAQISVDTFAADRDIRLEGGEIIAAALTNVSARDLSVRRLVTTSPDGAVSIEKSTFTNNFTVESLASLAGSALVLDTCRIGGSLMLDRLDVPATANARAMLTNCIINGHVSVSEQSGTALTAVLTDTHIMGKLRLDGLDNHLIHGGAPILTVHDSTVSSMDLPNVRYRGKRAIKHLCTSLFTAVNLDSLAILRASFSTQHRALSEDATYALMQDLMAERDRFGHVRRLFLGGVLGWGVELWPPLRAMLILVALTAAFVFFMTSAEPFAYHLYTSIIQAAGLWISIDPTAQVSAEKSALYGTAELVCGALGIVFTTVVVGIAIRKLVR